MEHQMETMASNSSSQPLPRWIRLLRILLTISVPILLTISSVRLVMTPAFLQFVYNRPDFPNDSYGFTIEDRLQLAPYPLAYLTNNANINYLGDLRLPKEKCVGTFQGTDDCPMYNTRELRHMQDVQTVTQYAYSVGIFLGILSLITIYFLAKTPSTRRTLRCGLIDGSLLTLGIIITIILAAIINWDFFFTSFHTTFFESGTWRFAFSDTLIRLFPEQFWFDAALTIGSLTTLGAVGIGGVSWWWKRKVNSPSI